MTNHVLTVQGNILPGTDVLHQGFEGCVLGISKANQGLVQCVILLGGQVSGHFILGAHGQQLDADGYERPMTVGKLLSEKVCIEGLFTTVLKSVYEGGEYKFRTKTNGADCVKTPLDMFETDTIDNDLKMVDKTIREYYGMEMPYKKEDK